MHQTETVIENETHKILWNFEIKTDHLIPAWISELVAIKKKKKTTCHLVYFAIPTNPKGKIKEREKKDIYDDFPKTF